MDDIRRMEEETKKELDEVTEYSIVHSVPILRGATDDQYETLDYFGICPFMAANYCHNDKNYRSLI